MSELLEQFKKDLAEVDWKEMRIHLRRDAIILVAAELDLVEVALAVAEDDKSQVETWIGQEQLGKPNAEQLESWEKQLNKPFRLLIVQPYILAQEVIHA